MTNNKQMEKNAKSKLFSQNNIWPSFKEMASRQEGAKIITP